MGLELTEPGHASPGPGAGVLGAAVPLQMVRDALGIASVS